MGRCGRSAIGFQLNYQAIGSGAGQNQILNRSVNFGASDAPMEPAKLQSGNLLQFPSVMGAVVVIVNIPRVKPNEMKNNFTIMIVTHDMQQAARCADQVAFLYLGELVELSPAAEMFTAPRERRTQEYITGRFG